MELRVNGKNIDTAPIKRLISQGESGVDTVTVPIPRMRGGVDLSRLTYTLRAVSDKNTMAAQVLTKAVRERDDTVALTWRVTDDFTAVSGALTLDIMGVNDSGEQIIHYRGEPISVGETKGQSFSPPKLDIFEQLLSAAQAALQACANEADRAKAEADRLAEFGISFKVLGFYETPQELAAAVTDPKQGDAYGVGSNPVYVYLWNGAAWQQWQALGIDLTDYYTKAKVDAALAEVKTQLSNKADLINPQEFNLPLAEGLIYWSGYKNVYWKNEFGEFGMIATVAKVDGTNFTDEIAVICTLPEGFRPNQVISASGCLRSGSISPMLCLVTISLKGEVTMSIPTEANNKCKVFEFHTYFSISKK